MKKSIKKAAFLLTALFMLSAFTNKEIENNELTTANCAEGYTNVTWSVTCPNGITYTGDRCFRTEHALQIAETILGAPCP